MSVWFEGDGDIGCDIEQVKRSFEDLGAHYFGVVGRMPGLTSVSLVEQGPDSVTIRTNEGLMQRTNIVLRSEADRVVVELDEAYQAGSKVHTTAHFQDEFVASGGGVRHRTVISGVEASGVLGFFYRTFGRANTGKAFLASYKAHLEQQGV